MNACQQQSGVISPDQITPGIVTLVDLSSSSVVLQIGKRNSSGLVYVGKQDIVGTGLRANFFEIPRSLYDMTGEIYTCDDTVRKVSKNGGLLAQWSVGSENFTKRCFASAPDNYREKAIRYLQQHIEKNIGNPYAYSLAVISPWLRPVKDMVDHKLAHGDESDFVLPQRNGSIHGSIVQSCKPCSGIPDYRLVVYGSDGSVGSYSCDYSRFGCSLFVAAPC